MTVTVGAGVTLAGSPKLLPVVPMGKRAVSTYSYYSGASMTTGTDFQRRDCGALEDKLLQRHFAGHR